MSRLRMTLVGSGVRVGVRVRVRVRVRVKLADDLGARLEQGVLVLVRVRNGVGVRG